MKQLIVCAIVCTQVFTLQAQDDRAAVKENPFSFEASYTGDAVRNFSGGIKTGNTYLGMASITIGFDTEKAHLWKGGEVFLHAANTHGGEPSATLIGDYQVASNIEAGALTYLQEGWFKQTLGKASFVVGLQDLCVEFVSSENAGLYLNSSFGVHSTIASNLSVPIFPLTALGAQFQYQFSHTFTFKLAAFDGIPDDFSTNKHNLNWKLSNDEGYLSFYEFSVHNPFVNNSGTYKLGGYYHNAHTNRFHDEGGLLVTENKPANYGMYAVIDQVIFNSPAGQSLSFFTQASISPKSSNENWYYLGAGANYKGLFAQRPEDMLGLACAHSGIDNPIGSETTMELTYKAQLAGNFFIQPDVQYIINPAGTNESVKNSITGILRFGLNF